MKIQFKFLVIVALLIYFPFYGMTVLAQVSFVEDLTPIQGVNIENEKKKFQKEVKNIKNKKIFIDIAEFRDINLSPQNITQIIAADLDRSGQFKTAKLGITIGDSNRPDFTSIKSNNIEGLLTGSVTRLPDGRFDIRYRLWDTLRYQDLGGQSFIVFPSDLRLVAHRIADHVYEKMKGDKGVFSTRITYITHNANKYMLWVSDADGENSQVALTSPEPIISPSWSPNGNELAYVSYEAQNPVIYIHDVSSGKRRVLANFKGSNSAPAWAPDGQTLAVTLNHEGRSQILILDSKGGDPRRITNSGGIDTEPVFTSDGRAIYFVSDRGGSPQIYRIPSLGGVAERITFNENSNTSPALSYDGKYLAFISNNNNSSKLMLMELSTKNIITLTNSSFDSKPSFAANSKLILFATQVEGIEALMVTTLDGKFSAKLSGRISNMREPRWGPFLKP